MLPCDNIFAGLITNIMLHIILFLIRNVLHVCLDLMKKACLLLESKRAHCGNMDVVLLAAQTWVTFLMWGE